MKTEIKSIMIVCDGCKQHFVNADNFCCFSDDPDGSLIESEVESSDWLTLKGKDGVIRHYCPDCYRLDEIYHTKDGRLWDAERDIEIEL